MKMKVREGSFRSKRRRDAAWMHLGFVLLLSPLVLAASSSCDASNNNLLRPSARTLRAGLVGRRRCGWLLIPRGGDSAPPAHRQALPTPSTSTTHGNTTSSTPYHHQQHERQHPVAKNIVAPIPNRTSAVASAATQEPTTVTSAISSWRESLPLQLQSKGPKTLQKICLGNTDIYLLGTAHVSNDSSTDVRLLLNAVHPDCIFVELCDARIPLLEGGGGGVDNEFIMPTNTTRSNKKHSSSLVQRIKETQQAQGGSRLQALSTVLLTSVQEDYATELGVELGGEFRCAHDYWKNCSSRSNSTTTTTTTTHDNGNTYQRPHLVLGDRPLYLTLVRAWESLRWWPKIKVVASLLWSSLRKPNKDEIREWLESVMQKESDVLTESFQELRKHFPTLYTTIISERDAWLAAKLTQTCFALSRKAMAADSAPAKSDRRIVVVAIVGMGHVPGICQWLTNQTRATTPEAVLAELVTTKRWANDEVVQREAIPSWVYEVSELQNENPAVVS